jgi:hypothetical protein
MKFFNNILIYGVLVFPFVLYSSDSSFRTEIEHDLASGKISQAQAIKYKLQSIKAPHHLPDAYKKLAPTISRSGTAIIAEASRLLSNLELFEQEEISAYLQRPRKTDLPLSFVSPSGLFRLHYTVEGVSSSDLDFVENVADYFDYAYEIQVNQMGYNPPPDDQNVDGPQWDIYLLNIPEYGYTTYENPVPETPWDDYTGYIEMDNDFTHTPTLGLDGAKVTAAHEFFHLIQLGYRSYNTPKLNSVFLYEMSSAWMEDVVYNDINDYFFYLDSYFRNFHKPFNTSDGLFEYGQAVFFHMIEKKYGHAAIRNIWESFKNNETFDALENAFAIYKTSLAIEITEFAIWNLFTGEQADSVNFYSEGAFYPQISVDNTFSFSNSLDVSGENNSLSIDYIKTETESSGDYTIWPTFENPFNWTFGAVYFPFEGQPQFSYSFGNSPKDISNIKSLSPLWLIPVNTTVPNSDHSSAKKSYQFSIEKGNAPLQENKLVNLFPNPYKPAEHEHIEIRFKLAKPSDNLKISILTEQGETVYSAQIGMRPDGDNKVIWDGKISDGRKINSGIYIVLLEADEFLQPGKFAVVQ